MIQHFDKVIFTIPIQTEFGYYNFVAIFSSMEK